jgi:Flp pilus assembly pilin Flp
MISKRPPNTREFRVPPGMPLKRLRSCNLLNRFLQSENGVTVVEYAVLISLVIAVVLFAGNIMGLVTAKGFSKLTAKPREVAQAETHQGFSEGHFDQKPSIAQPAFTVEPRLVRRNRDPVTL